MELAEILAKFASILLAVTLIVVACSIEETTTNPTQDVTVTPQTVTAATQPLTHPLTTPTTRVVTRTTEAGVPAETATTTEAVTTTQAKTTAALLPNVLPEDACIVRVPILMYHYVDDTPPPAGPDADELTVRTEDFIAEMDYLVEGGYRTVSLADVYLAMARQKKLPTKPVVLTFDDGGLDNYEVAFPILRERGFCATFFVITGAVGREGQMDWDDLREMAAQGMCVQSHTVSHPDLREVSASKLRSELVDSRQAIERAIGVSSYVLSYPYGAYNEAVIEAVRAAGYLMAVSTGKGKEGDPAGVFEMRRRGVSALCPLATFVRLVR